MQITREIAAKVLATVDAGLAKGVGNPTPGQMCVEAAVCYALGLPHGDDPGCVAQAVRNLKITLNDSAWSSKAARGKGMRRLALAQLGSAGVLDEVDFAKRVALMVVNVILPETLRLVAGMKHKPEHKAALLRVADDCGKANDLSAAKAASDAASDAASYAAKAASDAASYAASDAAKAASDAASYAASDAAKAASYAAKAAKAASDAASDKMLTRFADAVVDILVAMDAPGCEWLELAA